MTFEARDSAAKVVPARFKLSTTGPPSGICGHNPTLRPGGHGSLRTSASQTASVYYGFKIFFRCLTLICLANPGAATHHHHHDRHSLTQSFVQFSRGLALESKTFGQKKSHHGASPSGTRSSSLKVPQTSINRSPSAPNLVRDKPPTKEPSPTSISANYDMIQKSTKSSRRTFATCALLNPSLLQRHALSVDETPNYRSNDSLQHGTGSQGSMALDLHLESVTLKVTDKRRNPLKRQRKIEEDEHHKQDGSRRNSHSWSPRSPKCHHKPRRSSNASDCTHRSSRSRRRESHSCHHARRHLERAISSDSRLTGAIPKCYHSHEPSRNNSTEHDHQQDGTTTSENDIRKPHQVMVHFSPHMERWWFYPPKVDSARLSFLLLL